MHVLKLLGQPQKCFLQLHWRWILFKMMVGTSGPKIRSFFCHCTTHRLATRAWTFCHPHGKFGCRGLVQPHSGQKKSSPKSYQNGRLNGSSNCRMPEVGHMHLEVPWESLFGLKMKIYVEIPHSEQFWFYEKNFGHIWFFWLCLVKIAHFWTILTKTCFCSNDQYIWTKFVLNST